MPEIYDFAGDFHMKAGEPVKQWKKPVISGLKPEIRQACIFSIKAYRNRNFMVT